MKEQIRCSVCGAVLTEEAFHEFDGQVMCDDCFYEHTTECECCHERIRQENAEIDNDITLCTFCYDNYYTTCEICGRIIHRDNAHYEDECYAPYCDDCFNKLEEKTINSYNYKPELIFYGSGKLFYGVELEIDNGGSYDGNAGTLLDIANCDSTHMYCKYDGSVSNGFEMVSHPMSLDYHINHMDWLEIFNHAVDMGYCSHNTTT